MDEWPRATLLSTLKYSTFSIYSTLYIPWWRCFPLNLGSMSYFCCDETGNYLHDTHITPHPLPVHPVQPHWHLPLPALVNDSLVLHLILLIYLSAHRFPQPFSRFSFSCICHFILSHAVRSILHCSALISWVNMFFLLSFPQKNYQGHTRTQWVKQIGKTAANMISTLVIVWDTGKGSKADRM